MTRPSSPSQTEPDTVATRAGTCSYADDGDGVPLVMLHGLPGSSRDFRWLVSAVGGRARCLRLELPGFAGTELAGLAPTPHAHVRWLVATLDALEIERAVLVGHSFAGFFLAAAARAMPSRVLGLAFLSCVGPRRHRGFRSIPAPRALYLAHRVPLFGRAVDRRLAGALADAGFKATRRDERRRTLQLIAEVDFDAHARRLRDIPQPCLVAWANDDPLIESSISRALSDAVPEGPRLEFVTGGHNIQAEQAVEVADTLVPFARELYAGSLK